MTPEQSSFIATLAYTEALRNSGNVGRRLGDIVSKSSVRDDCPAGFTQDQWNNLLDQVQHSPELSQMVIQDITNNDYDGGSMITMSNSSTHEAVIAYQGTATARGWDEDLKSGYSLTSSQQEAIRYANEQTSKLGDDYYVYSTGHSKGGNESALVAAECDGIDRTYAFDAPGNAEAYFNDSKHAKRARDNAHKIVYYSNENCFVSGMNPRYDAEEHWLHSGYDEWAGMEALKGVLGFSPMAHSTLHLYNDDILNGTASFEDNKDENGKRLNKPSDHVVAINKLTQFLEQNLPPDDCRYLLDSLGQIVAAATSLGDEDLSDEERKEYIGQILQNLDPKTIGILLSLFEEYPESEELFNALMADGWVETLLNEYGADIAKYLGIGEGVLATASAVAPGLVALLGLIISLLGIGAVAQIKLQKAQAKAKMRASRANKAMAKVGKSVYDALKVHDFSEAKLALLERLVAQFKNTPIRALYQGWQNMFGASPFFRWVNLGFMQNITSSIISLLDSAIDTVMRVIRQKFQQAWTEDAHTGTKIRSTNESVDSATAMLQQLL